MATAAFDEEVVKNLATGKSFRAKIVPIGDIGLNTELGLDPRASTIFYVRDKTVLGWTAPGNELNALGAKFQVLAAKAPDNPAVLHAEIHAMKLELGVDT